jgi:1-acyl-sn-glycerol-3-phosphate acyltransferase
MSKSFCHITNRPLVIWPEGTRLKYLGLKSPNSIKRRFKPGLLKSIWEDAMATQLNVNNLPPFIGGCEAGAMDEAVQHPVQVMISNNKEVAFNEKKLHIQRGVEIRIVFGEPIYPADYPSFDQFLDAIACEWYMAYQLSHNV